MKTMDDAQMTAASLAFAQWAATGTLPTSYLQGVLGDQTQSVSPNVPPTSPTCCCVIEAPSARSAEGQSSSEDAL